MEQRHISHTNYTSLLGTFGRHPLCVVRVRHRCVGIAAVHDAGRVSALQLLCVVSCLVRSFRDMRDPRVVKQLGLVSHGVLMDAP